MDSVAQSFAFQQFEKLRHGADPVRVGPACRRRVPEVTPPVDHLLRRAAADPELEPAVADQIRRARGLDHVERVLVPHVDHARSDLDTAGLGTDRCEKREGGRELLRKVVDTEVRPVRAELLGCDSQLDRLLKTPRGRAADWREALQ